MAPDRYIGLKLTHCDCCGKRQWCAVNGTALCKNCCPAAVEEAQTEARRSQELEDEPLPPAIGEDTGEEPLPASRVAWLFR